MSTRGEIGINDEPEVLRCGECEARVDETREDGSQTKRVRCGISGLFVSPDDLCSADTRDLEKAIAQLAAEADRRRGDLLCGPGGTEPAEAVVVDCEQEVMRDGSAEDGPTEGPAPA